MTSAAFSSHPATEQPASGGEGDVAILTALRLAELDRLRGLGMQQARRLTATFEALSPEQEFKRMTGLNGTILGFERVSRAVRQIIVLEFELRGLFKAPDREARRSRLVDPDAIEDEPDDFEHMLNDLKDRDDLGDGKTRMDYRGGPMADIVAGIRKTLGAEPPENDPFAPPPAGPILAEAPVAAAVTPAPRPAAPQMQQAVKAAKLAAAATGGRGFRRPSKKHRKLRAAQAARPPGHNRGPPR